MDSPPGGSRPPVPRDSYAKFGQDLDELRIKRGLSFRILAARAHYAQSTMVAAVKGDRLPTRELTMAFVQACGGPVEEWSQRWSELRLQADRAEESRLPPEASIGHPWLASTPAELSAALRALQRKSGLSYAGLERLSRGQLRKSTVSNMLTGQTMPSWATAEAFISACIQHLPPEDRAEAGDLREWKRAWDQAFEARAAAEPAGRALRHTPARECDPYQLGVHRALPKGDSRALPVYVHRGSAEEELRQALQEARSRNQFILLVGQSGSGKTRLAYEMMLSIIPDFGLLHPAGTDALGTVPPPRTVVWLDDLDQYLRNGLTPATLQALLQGPRPVVILGTIWPDQYHAYMTLPRPGAQDAHQHEREVLTLATVIDVDVSLSPAELASAQAAASRDPRLAAALNSPDHGIFQNLAAGPHLIRRWNHAGDAYAKALITAAVDARRSGAPDPLAVSRLRDSAAASLGPSQRAQAPCDWLEKALSYATVPVPGGIAALTPVSEAIGTGRVDGYHVADFLLRHQEAQDARPSAPAGRFHREAGSEVPDHPRTPADQTPEPAGPSSAKSSSASAGPESEHMPASLTYQPAERRNNEEWMRALWEGPGIDVTSPCLVIAQVMDALEHDENSAAWVEAQVSDSPVPGAVVQIRRADSSKMPEELELAAFVIDAIDSTSLSPGTGRPLMHLLLHSTLHAIRMRNAVKKTEDR